MPDDVATPPWASFAWIALLPLTLWVLGAAAGASVFCLLFMKWRSKESWTISLALSLALGIGIHGLFSVLFQSQLYGGMLG